MRAGSEECLTAERAAGRPGRNARPQSRDLRQPIIPGAKPGASAASGRSPQPPKLLNRASHPRSLGPIPSNETLAQSAEQARVTLRIDLHTKSHVLLELY